MAGASSGRRLLHGSRALRMAEAETSAATQVILNFSAPTGSVMFEEPVDLVNIPGMTGEYGVAAEHAPTISELKPGMVQVFKTENGPAETFFVPGGMAITSENSHTQIAAADIATLEELDGSAAQKLYQETKKQLESLAEGTQEHAVAQAELDVYEAVCTAVGITL
eukprot:CAMPEP_0184519178 /NCGR_PEP_ID=MMETSP0198_2-20121128/6485_1 /TAXON_ID=1112570 /ORGANISM="Thraustochytrium sp., Strain LLF1b" /LENGTH=165 /DNA_ID=CAMNT_0026909671 /DNA_START=198 /DNA_END=695 /DNA_ORIENTATION=+